MGFNINGVRLLLHAKQLEVNFEKVITIGRQILYLREKELKSLLIEAGVLDTKSNESLEVNSHAERFLTLLGAKITDSLDASDYEGATHIHDLNTPLSKDMFSKYSLLIDGGSLEHVFNFPAAIKNCMGLIEEGGYYIGITPANNFLGHGFYQFSPELYYRIFCRANGFRMVKMYLYVDRKKTAFYEVMDPLDLKQRVTMANSSPTYLFILAQKTEAKEVFNLIPQQSDYEHIVWNNKAYGHHSDNEQEKGMSGPRKSISPPLYEKFLKLKRKMIDSYIRLIRAMGNSNPQFVRKIDLNLARNK